MVSMAEDTLAAMPPDTVDTPTEETPADEPIDEPIEEVAAPEAEEEVSAEEPELTPEPAVPGEELPEGVTREAKGLRVEESRWKTIYGNHQLVQQAAELLGEPVTREALELRQNAFQMQEQLYGDLNSADPKLQGQVLDFVLGDMTRAQREGEVGADPTVPFTQAFYEKIQQHPDAYAQLRFSAAKDLVGEMFQQAAQTNNVHLTAAAQRFALTLAGINDDLLKAPNGIATIRATMERMGLSFHLQEEMAGLAKGTDPASEMRARIESLESQLNGRTTSTQAAQFDSWKGATNQAIASGILDGAITPAIASVVEAWKPFPKEYQEQVVIPLHNEVNRVLGQDAAFKERIKQLTQEAQRAVSPQVRQRVTEQIKQLYTYRASQAIEANKRPILSKAAEFLKAKVGANHDRRAAGQSQTAPKGTTMAVPRRVTDGIDKEQFLTNGIFDPQKATRAMSGLFPR